MPNFSSLAGLEVPEKFVVEVPEDGFQVTIISNLNEVAFELLFRKICLNTKFFFQTQNFLPLKIFRPQILQKRLLEVLSSVDKLNN